MTSMPADLARRHHHRQPRPLSHWREGDMTPHPGPVARCHICMHEGDS